jgi:hypothetical protein
MGYIENNLVHGERVIFTTRLHWWAIVAYAVNVFFVLFAMSLVLVVIVMVGQPASRGTSSVSLIPTSVICSSILSVPLILFGLLAIASAEGDVHIIL